MIRYDEGQILNDKNSFFETCLNESLFEEKKIIIVSRITSKFYEIIKDLTEKNLSNKKTSGIASYNYYPKDLDQYITKIECFCYEIQTLNAGEENTYTLTMMIDPAVTKDSKTKTIKEGIIQFTFFDSKNYKENKN